MNSNVPFTMNLRSSASKQHAVQMTPRMTTIHGRRAVQLFTNRIHGTGSVTLFLSPRPSPKLRLGRVPPRRQLIKAATPPCLLHHGLVVEDDKFMDWASSSNSPVDSEMLDTQDTSIADGADRLIAATGDKMEISLVEVDTAMTDVEAKVPAEVDVKMEDVDDDEHVDIEMV